MSSSTPPPVDLVQAIILGVVQGLTEWLPISSSGHLALVQLAMGLQVPVFYDVTLHLGTLAGVFAVYRKDIADIIRSVFSFSAASADAERLRAARRMLWLIIVGTIPTAAIGLAFRSALESSFYDASAIAAGFVVTGVLLVFTKFLKAGSRPLGTADAIIIGIGQGASIFSSISRSGATIAAGLYRGVEKEQLVRYSFLLSIPAILGASAVDMLTMEGDAREQASAIGVESYAAGVAVSAAVGYASIRFLINAVRRGGFYLFAIYCFAVGVASFIFL